MELIPKFNQTQETGCKASTKKQGSAEAFSAMVQAMQGREQTELQIAQNTKNTAHEVKQMAKAAKKQKPVDIKVVGMNP